MYGKMMPEGVSKDQAQVYLFNWGNNNEIIVVSNWILLASKMLARSPFYIDLSDMLTRSLPSYFQKSKNWSLKISTNPWLLKAPVGLIMLQTSGDWCWLDGDFYVDLKNAR